MKTKNQLFLSAIVLFLAVAIGAFGAHALKEVLIGKYQVTFKTGSQYHFYHGLALLITAILNKIYNNKFKSIFYFFLVGIVLFSVNCYLYSITHIKTFALIVPVGGISFLIAWALLGFKFIKEDF